MCVNHRLTPARPAQEGRRLLPLCGDCIGRCEDGNIGYRLPGMTPRGARALFIALAAALHAVFLGVARI